MAAEEPKSYRIGLTCVKQLYSVLEKHIKSDALSSPAASCTNSFNKRAMQSDQEVSRKKQKLDDDDAKTMPVITVLAAYVYYVQHCRGAVAKIVCCFATAKSVARRLAELHFGAAEKERLKTRIALKHSSPLRPIAEKLRTRVLLKRVFEDNAPFLHEHPAVVSVSAPAKPTASSMVDAPELRLGDHQLSVISLPLAPTSLQLPVSGATNPSIVYMPLPNDVIVPEQRIRVKEETEESTCMSSLSAIPYVHPREM